MRGKKIPQLSVVSHPQEDPSSSKTSSPESPKVAEGCRSDLSAWRRLPSKIDYTPEGDFLLENYVTPIQMENASQQKLETRCYQRHPNLTPPGIWVIIFLDASEYEVYLKGKGESRFQKLDKTGQLDYPFRVEAFG